MSDRKYRDSVVERALTSLWSSCPVNSEPPQPQPQQQRVPTKPTKPRRLNRKPNIPLPIQQQHKPPVSPPVSLPRPYTRNDVAPSKNKNLSKLPPPPSDTRQEQSDPRRRSITSVASYSSLKTKSEKAISWFSSLGRRQKDGGLTEGAGRRSDGRKRKSLTDLHIPSFAQVLRENVQSSYKNHPELSFALPCLDSGDWEEIGRMVIRDIRHVAERKLERRVEGLYVAGMERRLVEVYEGTGRMEG